MLGSFDGREMGLGFGVWGIGLGRYVYGGCVD